jgi:hypothetical protein
MLWHERKQRKGNHEPDQGGEADDRPPRDKGQKQRNGCRKGRLSQVPGEVVYAEGSPDGFPVAVRDQHRRTRMLHARSDTRDDQANAETRKSEGKGHDQISGGGDEGRQRQGDTGAELGGEPVSGNLQAAHRRTVERPHQRQAGVGQTELRLPDRQKRVKLVSVTVMEEMCEARAYEVAPLERPTSISISSRPICCRHVMHRRFALPDEL